MLVPTGTINKVRMNNSTKDVVSTKELFGSGYVQDDRQRNNSMIFINEERHFYDRRSAKKDQISTNVTFL